jgi:myo-inositol-1(or 4)-monophosphatase
MTDGLIASLVEAAQTAGDLALGFFRPGSSTSAKTSYKGDGSLVTEADLIVDRFLMERLRTLLPPVGWLSEESVDNSSRLSQSHVLIVDPIDGTRGFAAGNLNWSIAFALVCEGRPILGIVHAPALRETYLGIAKQGAYLNGNPISVSQRQSFDADAKVAGPEALAKNLHEAGLCFTLQPKISSLAIRIAMVASGTLDAGFASENANDWDVAAADLILREAGGRLSGLDGKPLLYNRSSTKHGILIAAPEQLHAEVIAATHRASQINCLK